MYTVAVSDTAWKKKDGYAAYAMILQQIDAVREKYSVTVAAICTDSGGDCVGG